MDFRSSLLLLALAATSPAQTVWTVPNGADVNAVIAQASPGDILQLGAGHPSFTVDKGVTIVGQAGYTAIYPPPTSFPWVGGHIVVAVPPGQRASLSRLWVGAGSDGYFWYWGTVALQSGYAVLTDTSVEGYVTVSGGTQVVERMQISRGTFEVTAGICEISDSTLSGRDDGSFPPWGNTVGMRVTGGTVVGSRLTVSGGDAGFPYGSPSAAWAVIATGGTTYLTDCSLLGGNGLLSPSFVVGAPAFSGTGPLCAARTTFASGTNATSASASYQSIPELVGLRCDTAPTRGATFTVTATAGSSQGLLGMIGGFDMAPFTLPLIVEPMFGNPAQWIVLVATVPAPGAAVPYAVPVPNVASLHGVDVWVQAAQLAATEIRASVLVGGTIQ